MTVKAERVVQKSMHFDCDADAEGTMDIIVYKLWRGKSMHFMPLQPKDDFRESTEANLLCTTLKRASQKGNYSMNSKSLVVYHHA